MTTTTTAPNAGPAPDLGELARNFQAPEDLEDVYDDEDEFDDAHRNLFMTFRIGEQDYGIEILDVNEIVGLQTITEVPDVPGFVKGMINLRGNVIPVVDVRLRFGMEEREYDPRTCVVVVTVGDATVGLVVDRVNEVGTFPPESISPPPDQPGERAARSDFISGLGKQGDHVTILLDTARLLQQETA